jgi:site-specific DNA-cytosine methylase
VRVLIACEYSATVRDAFRERGHDAWSCDLLDCEGDTAHHIKGDVLGRLGDGWDLMIAHPPCTHLAVSGARYFEQKREDGRQQRAVEFFMELAAAPIPRIAIENPVCIMSTVWRKPDQIIQPWQFGHPESKTTCLWLKGLPRLHYTNELQPPPSGRWANQTPSGQNRLGPSPERWKIRSRTYQGIAEAMATQWGSIIDGAHRHGV